MPYGTYTSRRRGRRTKKDLPDKVPKITDAQAAWHLAKRAWQGIKYVKGLVNSELYNHENASTGTCNNTTGFITLLNNIAQGDGDGYRTGLSILQKGLYISLRLKNSATTPESAVVVRVMVLMDKQQIADTGPALTDILENTTAPYNVLSPLNGNSGLHRFTKLYDKCYELDTVANPQQEVKIYKRMQKHINYNGSAAYDIQKNGIYLVIFCDTGAATQPSYYYQARCYYHDN